MSVSTFYAALASDFQTENSTNIGNKLATNFIATSLDKSTANKTQYLNQVDSEFTAYTFNTVSMTVNKTESAGANTIAYVTRTFNVTDGSSNTIVSNLNTMDVLVPDGGSYKIASSALTNRQFSENSSAYTFNVLSFNVAVLQGCGDFGYPS